MSEVIHCWMCRYDLGLFSQWTTIIACVLCLSQYESIRSFHNSNANWTRDHNSVVTYMFPHNSNLFIRWKYIPNRLLFKSSSRVISSTLIFQHRWPNRLGLQNTPTASLQRGNTPPTSVLHMTLNNLMVRFQQYCSFGECGVPLYCHRSQVHSGSEWLHLIRVLSMG